MWASGRAVTVTTLSNQLWLDATAEPFTFWVTRLIFSVTAAIKNELSIWFNVDGWKNWDDEVIIHWSHSDLDRIFFFCISLH